MVPKVGKYIERKRGKEIFSGYIEEELEILNMKAILCISKCGRERSWHECGRERWWGKEDKQLCGQAGRLQF